MDPSFPPLIKGHKFKVSS